MIKVLALRARTPRTLLSSNNRILRGLSLDFFVLCVQTQSKNVNFNFMKFSCDNEQTIFLSKLMTFIRDDIFGSNDCFALTPLLHVRPSALHCNHDGIWNTIHDLTTVHSDQSVVRTSIEPYLVHLVSVIECEKFVEKLTECG